MKRSLLILFVLAFSNLLAQENTSEVNNFDQAKKNELSINLPMSIFGEFPEITYERLISPEVGIGTSAGFSLGSDGIDNLNFLLAPFARFYFISSDTGKPYQFGRRFFIEANAGAIAYSHKENYYDVNGNNTAKEQDKFGIGLGLAIGYKYVNKSNWIGTIMIGGGKIFNNDNGGLSAYPRVGINLGKRF